MLTQSSRMLGRVLKAVSAGLAAKRQGAVKVETICDWIERAAPTGLNPAILAFVDLPALRMGAAPGDEQKFMSLTKYSQRILDALRRAVGPTGTLFVATERIRDPRIWSLERRVFDANETPAADFFSETVRRAVGAIGARDPLFNLTYFSSEGPISSKYSFPTGRRPMGDSIVWRRLLELDPCVMLIGASDGADWTLLLPSHLDPDSYPRPSFFDRPWPFCVKSASNEIQIQHWHVHALRNALEYNFGRWLPMAAYADALSKVEDGLMTEWIGSVRMRCFRLSNRLEAQRELARKGVYLEDFVR